MLPSNAKLTPNNKEKELFQVLLVSSLCVRSPEK